MYDPLTADSGAPAVATGLSGCVMFGSAPTHDLVIRFALPDTALATLVLGWVPCGSGPSAQVRWRETRAVPDAWRC